MCQSFRALLQKLKIASLVANFGFDTAENEPRQVCHRLGIASFDLLVDAFPFSGDLTVFLAVVLQLTYYQHRTVLFCYDYLIFRSIQKV